MALFNPEGTEISEAGVDVPGDTLEGITIYAQTLKSIEFASTQGIRIDLTHVATPCRFRFISCAAFVSYDTLQIIEIQGLPVAQYAAISHVWASAPPKDGILTDRGAFLVDCENRNDGGPISIDVLYFTCLAALHEGASYLWLDRLCVLQTRRHDETVSVDKKWQIMRMHEIYQHCHVSLVLTTGLRRFPEKYEATEWVDRAWTFQEVMVAPEAKVIFVVHAASGVLATPMIRILPIAQYFEMQRSGDDDRRLTLERQQQFIEALRDRALFRSNETSEVLARYRTIWRFVQWRSSARQADVVFSVMAMLGVRLDPSKFKAADRFEATLALVQAMLRNDPSRNSYVKIPLWRAIDKLLVEEDCKKRGLPVFNVHDYMKRLPSIVRNIRELESVLNEKSVQGFSATTQRRLPANTEGDLEYEELKVGRFQQHY